MAELTGCNTRRTFRMVNVYNCCVLDVGLKVGLAVGWGVGRVVGGGTVVATGVDWLDDVVLLSVGGGVVVEPLVAAAAAVDCKDGLVVFP